MNKSQLRKLYKEVRNTISSSEKAEWDKRIFTQLINSRQYKNCDLILIYVSVGSEIDTYNIIYHALQSEKKVAVPWCNGKEMFFCEIHQLTDLVKGEFGIPSVREPKKKIISDFSNALCIVPAICYDKFGARIGYGGGYYDHFLSKHNVTSLGLCYERCIYQKIPCEKFDVRIDYILSEKCLRISKSKEAFTYE